MKKNSRTANGAASVIGEAGDVNQVAAFADAPLIAKSKVELPIEYEGILLLPRVHVKWGSFALRLGHNSRLS